MRGARDFDALGIVAKALNDRWPGRTPRVRLDTLEVWLSGAPRARTVLLEIPPDDVLVQRVALPMRKGTEREDLLQARLADISPWAREAAFVAEIGDNPAEARLFLAARAPALAARDRLEAEGIRVLGIVSIPEGERRLVWFERNPHRIETLRRLLLSAVALWSIGFAIIAAAAGLTLPGLSGDLARLRTELASAEARIGNASARTRAVAALLADRAGGRSIAGRIAALAAALPPDAALTSLVMEGDAFQLAGQSAHPEHVLPALEASGQFGEVRPAAASALEGDGAAWGFALEGQFGGTP